MKPPVITIDGPSGTGKGTLCLMLATALNWHVLDSGKLYRALAYAVQRTPDLSDTELSEVATGLDVHFKREGDRVCVYLKGEPITDQITTEDCARVASKLAAKPIVRQALLQRQRDFQQMPGLVADGRDMGSVVFPEAPLKFYLDATPKARAKRRYQQLKAMGLSGNLAHLERELMERDERDKNRSVAPLKPAKEAVVVDTTNLSVEQVYAFLSSKMELFF